MEHSSIQLPQKQKKDTRLAEIALALGGFALGTSEFSAMGMLPDIASSLEITEAQVGHLISAYALGVVVGAPLIAIFGSYTSRKYLIIILMLFFVIGNIASSIAPDYLSLILSRFIAGLPHGAYFGVGALVAASLVPLDQRAKAVSRFMLGVTLSIVVGTPLATWIGQLGSWRYAFAIVAVLALFTAVMAYLYIPKNLQEKRSNPLNELSALKLSQVWLTLGIAAIGFSGMFCVFSYLGPTILHVTNLQPIWIPFMISIFGIGSVFGAMIGGWLCDKYQFNSVGYILIGYIIILLSFPYMAQTIWSMIPAVFLVGCTMALSPALQIRLMDVSADAPTLAVSLSHAAFNLANALGPWLGGVAITAGLGWTVTGYIGAITAFIGLGIFLIAKYVEQKKLQASCTI